MGLFSTKIATRRLEEQVGQLRDDCDVLLREMNTLKLSWEETYDKIHRLFGRIAKRTALDNPEPGPAMAASPSPDDGLDDISRSILARRKLGKH